MRVKMKDIIQIEPFKFSIVQLLFLCFLAGVTWAGYINLSASVSKLTETMSSVNTTMLVLQTEKSHRDTEILKLQNEHAQANEREITRGLKLENHDVRIDALESKVYK